MSIWDDMRTLLPDNTTGDISALDMRNIVTMLEGEDADNVKGAEEVNVYLSEASATDISDTISGITDATATKRYVLTLGPGVHTTKAVVMKPYVSIKGVQGGAVKVIPTATNLLLFTMADDTWLTDVVVSGCTTGIGVRMVGAGSCVLEDVVIEDCITGISVGHVDAFVSLGNVQVTTPTITATVGVTVTAGNVTINGLSFNGASDITTGLYCNGADAVVTASGITSFSLGVATAIRCAGASQSVINTPSVVNATVAAIRVDTAARAVIKGGGLFENTIGLSLPDDASAINVEVTGTSILANALDISALNTTGKLRLSSVSTDLFNCTIDTPDIVGSVSDETAGDEGVQVFGELKVGTGRSGGESVLGEGDSYSGAGRVLFYTWDGSAWVDETDDLSDPGGNTVEFPNGSVGTAIYMASRLPWEGSVKKHSGFKMIVDDTVDGVADLAVSGSITPDSTGSYEYYADINGNPAFKHAVNNYWIAFIQGYWCIFSSEPSAGTLRSTAQHAGLSMKGDYAAVNGTGTASVSQPVLAQKFAIEYWNGVAWVPFNYMCTESGNAYVSHGKEIFRHRGDFQVRYDAKLESYFDWAINDPMSFGTNYYWTRIRITSALSQSPVLQQIKLHTNRLEVNDDGYVELYGKARSFRKLAADPLVLRGVGTTVGDQDAYLGDLLHRSYVDNAMDNGDIIGFNTALPRDIDTSTPLKVAWSVFSASAQSTLTWTVRWGYSADGDSVYPTTALAPTTGANEQNVTTTGALASANVQYTFSVDLDLSDLLPAREGAFGDTLWITLELTSGQATNTVNILQVQPVYLSHTYGGHV